MGRYLLRVGAISCFALLIANPGNAGPFKTIYSFTNGSDGASPLGGVTFVNGTLFGTAATSGAYGYGTVFAIDSTTGAERTLYGFSGTSSDGGYPATSLLYDKGMLYGTTDLGGQGSGTLFKIKPATGTEATLYSFSGYQTSPSGVVRLGNVLFGATYYTGFGGPGMVYKFDLATGQQTTLYSFTGGADGSNPAQILLYSGFLYGVTFSGGAYSNGTLFKIDPSTGSETTLYNFGSGQDGQAPAGLAANDGIFYGVTISGGTSGFGTIYKFDPIALQEFMIYSFAGGDDGCNPASAPVVYRGKAFGSTLYCGGAQESGALYEVNLKTGRERTRYRFPASGEGGSSTLTVVNGTLYGTTASGGANFVGSVFSYTP
jgi:uncharacterized repeat protein (TIGR03803 family)